MLQLTRLTLRRTLSPLTRLASSSSPLSTSSSLSSSASSTSPASFAPILLPCMESIERVQEVRAPVPSFPDSYASSTPSADRHFVLRPLEVETVSSKATHLDGGPSQTGTAAK
ncbi:hypothetical protein JCM8547_005750 [Rhodosporidiobolus lusitaniae]